jgi:nucleoside-diphosphate-sugar epimerase
MKKILIIGKRGFIGKHLYKYLKQKIIQKILVLKI